MNKKQIITGLLLVFLLIGFLKREAVLQAIMGKAEELKMAQKKILTIVLSTPETDLSPIGLDLNNLVRTANVYEGLVAFDKKLKVVPALALSWGNLSPTRWEFKLRRDVLFHDNTPFNAQSIAQSFSSSAKALPAILKTIKTIETIDEHTIIIETNGPDPLLLNKLTKFFIHRPKQIGTGPYKFSDVSAKGVVSLSIFKNYWGKRPAFSQVEYRVMTGKLERRQAFENGEIDLLVDVPRDQALELPQEQIKKIFSMEVNFLMFNPNHPILSEKQIRQSIISLIDPGKIEAIGNYFVRPSGQWVAPGVFGFNPEIVPPPFEEKNMAKDLFGKRIERITLDFLETYRTLSEYIAGQLRLAGFSVISNPLPPEELLNKVRKNQSELFLLGWQAEDGDAGGFLDAFIHSSGEFNGGRFVNPQIDLTIEAARQEMDPEKRLILLQDVMRKIQEEVIGIPLFESSRIYALKPGIQWEPRTDGLVLASEVR